MGILSALFGLGQSKDSAQDDRLAALETRMNSVEARPSGGVDPTIVERLSVLETRIVVDAAARSDAASSLQAAQGAAAAAAAALQKAAANEAAVAGVAASVQAIHERVAAIEIEIDDVRNLPSGGNGGSGTGDGGGITLPEINP